MRPSETVERLVEAIDNGPASSKEVRALLRAAVRMRKVMPTSWVHRTDTKRLVRLRAVRAWDKRVAALLGGE